MNAITVTTRSVEETQQLAALLARAIPRPALLALTGRLGAGKTHFIKGLGPPLGIDPTQICSPTFVLITEHGPEDGPRLVHIDAYRLNSPDELDAVGFTELLDLPDAIIAVEWAEKIATILPADRLDITIDINDNHSRTFTLTPHGQKYQAALQSLSL